MYYKIISILQSQITNIIVIENHDRQMEIDYESSGSEKVQKNFLEGGKLIFLVGID